MLFVVWLRGGVDPLLEKLTQPPVMVIAALLLG
jgi:hypothetical protein